MKTLVLLAGLALVGAGCLSSVVPEHEPGGADMAVAGTGGNGSGTGNGTGSHNGSGEAMDDGGAAMGDLAGVTPTGTKQFGDLCTTDGPTGDCASGMCKPFAQGTVQRCTKPCTVATQATDCPNPPSSGTCTNNNYCKFTQ